MRVAGIDPGTTGAVAWVDSVGLAAVVDLPTGPHGIDPVALQEQLQAWGVHSVYLEDNRANGRNGSLANFSMGRSEGLIVAAVLCMELPLHRIKPKDWQRRVGLSNVAAADRKEASRMRAREMFPSLKDDLKRKKDHNRAEAVLIAFYGQKESQ